MGFDLYNDDYLEEESHEEENPYLANAAMGLELVLSLLPQSRETRAERLSRSVDYLLDRRLIDTLGELRLAEPLRLKKRLYQLSDRLMEYKKIKLLKGKMIIGVGGAFSAGKTCFINSLLDSGSIALPEDETPTTAIPTYVIGGNEEIRAYTADNERDLDSYAMTALTHKFLEKHGIALGRYVDYLTVSTPGFSRAMSSQVALMDTPGYNKGDSTRRGAKSDKKIALKGLTSVDALIWLVNADAGVINVDDLAFLHELAADIPLLVIFTRADQKTPEDMQRVVDESRKILADEGLKPFGVAAYDSRSGEEKLGGTFVRDFFAQVTKLAAKKQDATDELLAELDTLRQAFAARQGELVEDNKELEQMIKASDEPLALRALVALLKENMHRQDKLAQDKTEFDALSKDLIKQVTAITA